ncbi:MAG: hypothetical protein HUU49_00575 [Candidatus Buchananbacteria bacterium]|nr:hypothetical protein [Candidatus Buchananbacteria bacterium]
MIKRLLTYAVVITTVVWSVGLLATPIAVGAAVSGDLIKLQCAAGADVNDPCRAVYYLGADGKRYVFPNEKTYKTWYSDFSGVQTVSQTEMSSYPIGGNVTYRPGVKLVKITTDPKVYAVGSNGTLHWVTTGEIAEALYGATWATMVEDVPDAFFVNYTVGSDINAAADYNKQTEMDNAATINDDKNLGGGASTGTSLNVALASDTPATGLIVGNSINNKFTKVNLTASADGDMVIDQLVVRRGGTIAADSAFSSIAIIDAATGARIGNTKTLNSQHMAVFNEDITVAAGTTKSIYLAGNMAASLATNAGEIPTLDLYSVTLSGGGAVIGSLPIVGNYQTLNGTITIGALSVSDGSNNPDASTQKIGTTNYLVSGFKLVANSVEDFHVTSITFDQGGTAADDDVSNLDLIIDDTIVKTVAAPSNGKVMFDLSASPVLVEKGKTVQVDLQLDIADGSSRTIRFDIEDESDIVARGQLYGAEVKVSDGGAGAASDATPFWTAPVTTVDTGSLRIGAATLSAANIPEDSDQVVLGKFEFEAKGEPVEISSLPIGFRIATSTGSLATDSGVDLTNITVYDANGAIVAGPSDPTYKIHTSDSTALLQVTSTDTFTVPTGLHIYTIKGDVDSDFGTNDTIVAHIKPGQVTAKGETTGLTVTPTPTTSELTSATMTVQSAQLAVSVSSLPVAQSVVAGTKGFTFANVVLGAESSGEDIKVTSLKVQVDCLATCSPSQTSNWSLYDGATKLSVTNDPDSQVGTKTTAADDATSTFNLTTPLVIAKGTSKTLTVKADLSTDATSGTITVGIEDTTSSTITAKGNNSGLDAALTVSVSDGQTMTLNSGGALTITRDTTSPKDGLLPANSEGLTFAVFSAVAQYEDVNIEKLYLTAVQANSGGLDQINKVYIYNGSTKLAEVTPTSTDGTDRTVLIDVTNNPIVVAKDTSVKLTIKVDTANSNYEVGSKGASGQGLWLKIASAADVTAKGAQSGTTLATAAKTINNASSTAQYLFRSVPTLATNDLLSSGKVSGGTLTAGTEASKSLYAFSVTADSKGDIALHRVNFNISTNVATITNMMITDGTENVAYQLSAGSSFIGTNDAGTDSWTGEAPFFFVNNQTAPSAYTGTNVVPYVIPAGTTKTFTLKGDVQCAAVGGSDCSTSSGSGSLSIQMLGDTSLLGTVPTGATALAASDAKLGDAAFVWSDLWRTSIQGISSTTASTTEQWSNGAYVALSNGGKMIATSSAVTFSR